MFIIYALFVSYFFDGQSFVVVALDSFFFHLGKTQSLFALDRWWSHTVTIVREFARADLALVFLDMWSS